MIHFEIDENKNCRLFSKFQNECTDNILCNCYKNKLELGCGYKNEIENKNVLEIVSMLTKESNSQSRRLIEQGAFTLLPKEEKITDPQAVVDLSTVTGLKIGKRRFYTLV